jgi:hypothetical protein
LKAANIVEGANTRRYSSLTKRPEEDALNLTSSFIAAAECCENAGPILSVLVCQSGGGFFIFEVIGPRTDFPLLHGVDLSSAAHANMHIPVEDEPRLALVRQSCCYLISDLSYKLYLSRV